MPTEAADFPTPEAAEAAFYMAFANTDLAAMARVWHASPADIRCVHPGGDLLAGGAVLESWRSIFSGTQAPSVQYRLLHQTRAGDISIHLVEERVGPAGSAEDALTRILATNVYRRTAQGWGMTLHHATLPLVKPKAKEHGPMDIGDRLH
jgi:hypothetical protein